MIDRGFHGAERGTAAGNEPGGGFVNPWAECWSSRNRCPSSAQMHADAAAPRGTQMAGAGHDAAPHELASDMPADLEADLEADVAVDGDAIVRTLPIINNKGLHARASAKFVQCVEGFDASIKVSRGGETVGGMSIMGLMMLAAARGTQIVVEAQGRQAQEAMDAIEALVASKFGEEC